MIISTVYSCIELRQWTIRRQPLLHINYTDLVVCACSMRQTIQNRVTLQWRHNWHDGVPNHQSYDCLLNRLFRRRSKKTSKLRVTGFCAGNSPVTDEFPAQMTSNAENVSIWWRHHEKILPQQNKALFWKQMPTIQKVYSSWSIPRALPSNLYCKSHLSRQ